MARPLKKRVAEARWSNDAVAIMRAASSLVLAINNASKEGLEQARDRMQEFNDAWLKTGEGSVLPCSGKNAAAADEDGRLCDVDVFEPIVETLTERLEYV